MRQQYGLGDGNAQLAVPSAKLKNLSSALHQKGLLMTTVPERAGILQVAAIEGNVVRDAVHDDVVGRRLGHANFADRVPAQHGDCPALPYC